MPEGYTCSLTDLVKIAGTRWKVQDDFQDSKSTVGLDQRQVRLYRAWKRHVTLAMAALAFPAVLAAIETAAHPAPILPADPGQAPPADCGTIALTVPEAQRLFHLFSTLIREMPPRRPRPARTAPALVRVAPTPPSTRAPAPPPDPSRTHRVTQRQITIYDWSTTQVTTRSWGDCAGPDNPSMAPYRRACMVSRASQR